MAALYADAIMIQHPWEYWKHNGDPQPWTPELLAVLEKALQHTPQHSPQHPGENHYYIHSVEASCNPQRALPSANRVCAGEYESRGFAGGNGALQCSGKWS